MRKNTRALSAIGMAALLALALPSWSSAADSDEPTAPQKATPETTITTAEEPLVSSMLQFVASAIETEQELLASPNRPPDRPPSSPPGQNNPPNPPGKPRRN